MNAKRCPHCGARGTQPCTTKSGRRLGKPHRLRPSAKVSEPKRTMAVMKGLAEMARVLEPGTWPRSTRANVAQAIEWIARIDAFDHGRPIPPRAKRPAVPAAECVGDT